MISTVDEFAEWFADRHQAHDFGVSIAPLSELEGWQVASHTGVVSHQSGRFFSVEGITVSTNGRSWSQPIIRQPEIGILGILVRKFGDQYYCLMQAKMEPGNINLLQLSPTVQATRSNYTQVHRGRAVPHVKYFVAPKSNDSRIVFDSLQSEQGSWFLGKRNRNMIVETTDFPAHDDDFRWLSVDLISELMRIPNLINMDSRTVLSCLPLLEPTNPANTDSGLHSLASLLSWFTQAKAQREVERGSTSLLTMPGWTSTPEHIFRPDGRHFTIIGINVRASSREVSGWSQPMLCPVDQGVIAFLGRHIDDQFHVLVHARTEAGTGDVVEMGPTVACIPASYRGLPESERPRFLDIVEEAENSSRILVDVVQSEEGGRFYHAENRYLLLECGSQLAVDVPPDYCWMTVDQVANFVRYSNHVNVAARCLLSCLDGSVLNELAPAR